MSTSYSIWFHYVSIYENITLCAINIYTISIWAILSFIAKKVLKSSEDQFYPFKNIFILKCYTEKRRDIERGSPSGGSLTK